MTVKPLHFYYGEGVQAKVLSRAESECPYTGWRRAFWLQGYREATADDVARFLDSIVNPNGAVH